MATKTKAVSKSAAKTPAPKSEKAVKAPKVPQAKLVSFSVSAVIPTQQYGNIQPKIEVMANSIEEARAVVMPIIEDLYKTYAEAPLNGRELKFLGKVVETVKDVVKAPVEAPSAPKALEVAPSPSSVAAPAAAPEPSVPAKAKSDPVLKAEKAISLAATEEAAVLIQDQIEKSVKIAPEDKPELITLILKKRSELKGEF